MPITMKFNGILFAFAWFTSVAGVMTSKPENLPVVSNIHKFCEFATLYDGVISRNHPMNCTFQFNETGVETVAVRISSSSKNATLEFPVLFVVRKQDSVISWQIPVMLDYKYDYYIVSRTLCPGTHPPHPPLQQLVYIDVTTMSTNHTQYSFKAKLLGTFQIMLNDTRNVTVTPSQPMYFKFNFPLGVDSVIVNLRSFSEICTTVSIQEINCPVYDLDKNVDFRGQHQTMTRQATVTVMRKNYALNAFFIVLVVKANNKDCSLMDLITPREKSISVTVVTTIPDSDYIIASVVAVSVFLGIYLLAFIIACTYQIRYKNWGMPVSVVVENEVPTVSRGDRETEIKIIRIENFPSYGATESDSPATVGSPNTFMASAESNTVLNDVTPHPDERIVNSIKRRDFMAEGSTSPDEDTNDANDIDTNDIDFLRDAMTEKAVLRTKSMLHVSDLACKTTKQLQKRYSIYSWNMLTVAIFYGLPVIQLVITYQIILHETGNEDTCYYNFACAHPLSVFSAFNSVFSNIGYVMLGVLFLVLVRRRDILHHRAVLSRDRLEKFHGIPEHYGLFYTMGIALIMEGIMSACYHVCPNYSNFQFDTSFMYITACLLMLKVYQNRHPDINARAHVAFLFMALLIFIAVIGVTYGTEAYWVVFTIFHILAIFILSGKVYYMGQWKIDLAFIKGIYRKVRTRSFSRPNHVKRFVLLLLVNIMNWAMALYGAITRPHNFASFLLAILIINLMLYTCFYVVMKLLNGERIKALPLVYILTSIGLWAGSLYFFFQHVNSWQDTPAVSREKNRSCILLGFFDHHDVWHFMSAMSLFTSFMVIKSVEALKRLLATHLSRVPP